MSKLYAFFSVSHGRGKFELDFLGSSQSKDATSAIRGFLGSQCNREKYRTWDSPSGTFLLDPKLMKQTKKLGRENDLLVGWFLTEITPGDAQRELYRIQEDLQAPSPLVFAF